MFFIGGGGSKFFLQICFIRNRRGVTVFFGKEKMTPCRLVDPYLLTNTRSVQKPKTCIYKQSYQPRLI